ncbi:MAG: polyphenol oxidase family protein [Gemmatimonadetes bacterium]|uniref:Polyphenol oxidase family protein n=1 Tax=Candidatus Kutchimonas denitrificans TaxID=3056748 RepID=A0AAE5CCN7_9BACT|nr:polyphenol oxidase family protein [Gemmatimonadota bacterium]NIR76218.1 polyphenol oxidase family protein [Candidatus Kutchimonas denitrificans]NIS00658.1 polyphenol oxidase family protein [Gemmatimonadota bacterium]NIT66803.1 polyphenol oxidase family protein [Gemmatimonadota bacterium]NIV23402.1 hypothetical protein [Gemmatimonadota bacterium]
MRFERQTDLGGIRIFQQAEWTDRFPGLVQGITARAPGLDFGLPGADSGTEADSGNHTLRRAAGLESMARCRQVHGDRVVCLDAPLDPGLSVVGAADALVTPRADLLLAVTVADCVPAFFVDPEHRLIALSHAGWRGTAAGVIEATLAAMRTRGGVPAALFAHLGPAICGRCYQVGPEVAAALGLEPAEHRTVDLRANIAGRLEAAGLRAERITASEACTRCHGDDYYSFRGGDRGHRMCAFLGWSAG